MFAPLTFPPMEIAEQLLEEAIFTGKEYCLAKYQEGSSISIPELYKLINDPFKGLYLIIDVNFSFVSEFLLNPEMKIEENTEKDQIIFIKEKCP